MKKAERRRVVAMDESGRKKSNLRASPRIAELCERVLMAKLVESIRLGRVEL